MQIIDAHHHLWDMERHDHPWLKPETAHPAGDLTPICRSYQLDDFLADAQHQSLVKSVHLQAGIEVADSVEETAWLQAIADDPASGGFPHGIVAFAGLKEGEMIRRWYALSLDLNGFCVIYHDIIKIMINKKEKDHADY